MACGYILCPCCGYDTVATDDTVPELCSECEALGCSLEGDDPQCEHCDAGDAGDALDAAIEAYEHWNSELDCACDAGHKCSRCETLDGV